MASKGTIDELVSEKAFAEVERLITGLAGVNTKFSETLKNAKLFTDTLAGAKGLKDVSDGSAKAEAEIVKLSKATDQAAITQEKLKKAILDREQAEIRATQAAQREAAKQQAILDKQVAAEQAAAAKIQAAKDKRASQIGPTYIGGQGSSKELTNAEAEAIGAKTRAEDQERVSAILAAQAAQQKTDASKQATTQIKAEVDQLSAQDKIIRQTLGSLDQNIQLDVQYRLELQKVQQQLKANVGDTVALTRREQELKAGIQANSTVMKQQIKDQQATTSSADGLNARLSLLRTAYNNLTESERKNSAIGGVLLKDITDLDSKTKEIAKSQGLYNKSVVDYENAIKKAISSYVPYGNQLVKGVDALKGTVGATADAASGVRVLGFTFAAFTITAFAVAISSAVFYLQQFQGTADRVDIRLAGLKARFGAFGGSIVEGLGIGQKSAPQEKTPLENYLIRLTKTAQVLSGQGGLEALGSGLKKNTDAAAAAGEEAARLIKKYEDLNTVTDLNVKINEGAARKLRAQSKNKNLDFEQRVALLDKADAKEREVIKLDEDRAEAGVKLAVTVSQVYKKLSTEDIKRLEAGDLAYAVSLNRQSKITKDGFELYKSALTQRVDSTNKANLALERINNDRENLTKKNDKQINTDSLELAKEKLEGQKLNAKLILDDDKQTFDARLAALKIYVNRSNSLIDNELSIANTGASPVKKQANSQRAKNEKVQVALFETTEEQKIRDEAYKTLIKSFVNYQLSISAKAKETTKTRIQQAQEDNLNELEAIQNNASDQLTALEESYAKGEINKTAYEKKKLDIEHDATSQSIKEQIHAAEILLQIQTAAGIDTAAQRKELSRLRRQLDKSDADYEIAQLKTTAEARKDAYAKAKELADEVFAFGVSVVNAGYENEKNKIQERSDALTEQSAKEIEDVNRSIGTEQQKADKIAIINARAKAQQDVLDQRKREVAVRQAKFDKAVSLAKVVESTYAGAARALADYPFPFSSIIAGLVIAIGAAQAAQIIATPIPKYAKGTDYHKGGAMIVGDAGTELVIEPNGRRYLTPDTDTLTTAPAGTRVLPNHEVIKMLAKPEKINYVGGQAVDIQQLVSEQRKTTKAIQGQKMAGTFITKGGWKRQQQQVSNWNAYRNNHFN